MMKVIDSYENYTLFPLLFKVETDGVHTVALAGRFCRTVFEHMPQMRTAVGAEHLRALHAVLIIVLVFHCIRKRLVEGRPTGSRLELRIRTEQRITADLAVISACRLLVQILPASWHFRTLLAKNVIFLW